MRFHSQRITIGILGGFTTFSTFSYETVAMMWNAEYVYAAGNILFTVLFCLVGTYVGLVLGKLA